MREGVSGALTGVTYSANSQSSAYLAGHQQSIFWLLKTRLHPPTFSPHLIQRYENLASHTAGKSGAHSGAPGATTGRGLRQAQVRVDRVQIPTLVGCLEEKQMIARKADKKLKNAKKIEHTKPLLRLDGTGGGNTT